MKEIEVEIEGETPLLMCSSSSMSIEKTSKIVKETNFEKEAYESAYWSSNGKKELVVPSNCLYAAIINAASGYRVGKKSAVGLLAGVIRIDPPEISLGTDKYQIDIRQIVINKTARLFKARARLDKWKLKFKILYNEKYLPKEIADKTLYSILEEAGVRYGIMAYRPQRKGWFGTFKITKWKTS
jgi:hypothetical protein